MKEDVSKGEYVTGWKLTDGQTTLVSGMALGIKRIRVLKCPVRTGDVRLETDLLEGAASRRQVPQVRFYYVNPKTLNRVMNATTTNGETDTAQWMTKGTAK